MKIVRTLLIALILPALLLLGACSENMGRGAALGAATGAGLGVLGHGGIVSGAAKGAAVGAAGGFIYDHL